jgi:colicin import membrane protein
MSDAALTSREAFAPREHEGRARGIGLSVLVHAGLVVAIAFGVSWRSRTPEAYEAELWAALPQAAAPRAVEPPPAPAPTVVQKAEPPPTPTPAPQVVPDPQIATEQERREKLRQQQAEAQKKRRAEEARQAKEREAQRAADERALAAKLRQQQEAADAAKKKAEDEQAAKRAEVARQDQLARIRGLAGATGAATDSGTAARSAGPSASYAGMIVARLKRESTFIGAVAGNPKAEVEIRVSPDGTIVGRRLVRSSGVAAWDEAVLRAIDKAGALPRDVDGRVQNPTIVVWGPQD